MINNDKQILISTVLSRLGSAIELAQDAFESTGITSIISCQTFENIATEELETRTEAYKVVFSETVGLSNNRNNAFNASDAKYVWFLDDDVKVIAKGCFEAFEKLRHGEFSVITTCYVIDDGNPRKKYSPQSFAHNKLSIMKVSSIEIFCDREHLLQNCIEFDTDFGLGAVYKSGEENILLANCLDAGLKVGFEPVATSSHPNETSGGVYDNAQQLVTKGAIIRKVYGILGWPLVVIFFLKRFKNKELSFIKTCNAIWQGSIGFCQVKTARK